MKALTIGGGVAGPVAAMSLHRAGVASEMYERYPRAAIELGAFLTFAVNGMDALRAIGANTAVTGLGFPTPTLVFRSGSGKLLGTVPLGAPWPTAPSPTRSSGPTCTAHCRTRHPVAASR